MSKELVVPCQLRDLREWSFSANEETKKGRYHGSRFREVPEKHYVVGAYIEADWHEYISEGYSEEEVVLACIRHLNTVPPRQKFQRATKKSPYGKISPQPVQYKFREDCIEVLLVTDKRKSRVFWGEGVKC